MATLEEIMAALNAGGSASNMSSSDLATLMSGGGAMSSGTPSPYTDYGGTNSWTDPNSPEFKSRMDTLTNTMLSGQRNQVEDYVRRASLSGVQRGGYNVAGAPNYAGGLQREAINALAGGYDTRYTNALNYLMNAGTLNEKGIERSFTAEQNSKQQAATAALQKAGFDQQTAERLAGEAFTGGENTKARDLQVTLQKAGFDQQTAERLAGEVFTAAENKAQRGWQSGENTLGREFTAGENATQRGWQSGENTLGREFTAGENTAQRGWQSGENTAQRGWQSGENTAQRGWQSGENTTQRGWQSGENTLGRELTTSQNTLDRAIAQQNANTSATGTTGNLANQTAAQKLAQDRFDFEKQYLAADSGPSGGPTGGSGGGSSGGPSGGPTGGPTGGRSGGPTGGGSGPPGLGPSANLTPGQLSALGYNYQNVRDYDPTKPRPYGQYNMWVKDGETYGANPYAQEYSGNPGYDPSLMGYTQAGADAGTFAPTPQEYQDSWTGSTSYDDPYKYEVPGSSINLDPWTNDTNQNNSYNYEVPGSSIDPWATSDPSWDSYW